MYYDIRILSQWLDMADECTLGYDTEQRLCFENACLEPQRQRMTELIVKWLLRNADMMDVRQPEHLEVLRGISAYCGDTGQFPSSPQRRILEKVLEKVEITWIYSKAHRTQKTYSYEQLGLSYPEVDIRTWTDGVLRVTVDVPEGELKARFGKVSACSLSLIAQMASAFNGCDTGELCRDVYRQKIKHIPTRELIVEYGSVVDKRLQGIVENRLLARAKRQSLAHFMRQLGRSAFCLPLLPTSCVERLGHKMTESENKSALESLDARVFAHLLDTHAFGAATSKAHYKAVLTWFRAHADEVAACDLVQSLPQGRLRVLVTHTLWNRMPRFLRLQLLRPCSEAELRSTQGEDGESVWDAMSPRMRDEFREVTLLVGHEKTPLKARAAQLVRDAQLARRVRRSSSVSCMEEAPQVWKTFLERGRSGSVGRQKSPRSIASLAKLYKKHKLSAESVDAMRCFDARVLKK